jgi:hypothetical protein
MKAGARVAGQGEEVGLGILGVDIRIGQIDAAVFDVGRDKARRLQTPEIGGVLTQVAGQAGDATGPGPDVGASARDRDEREVAGPL